MREDYYDNIKRYFPDLNQGLNEEEVKNRVESGLNNISSLTATKTIPKIIRDNILTLFNIINFILFLSLLLIVHSFKDILFMGVVICNLVIGTFQEIRAKKSVDKLSLLNSVKAKVIRSGRQREIEIEEIVLDDILILESGNQIPTDCIILNGTCEVNESLLTGESDSITKKPGDLLLSGSFIISGNCKAKTERVGQFNYISKISQESKYIKKNNSQILNAFNKIILITSFLIIPVGVLFFLKQINLPGRDINSSISRTVAVLIGMIPEGLVLLTSTVLAISVIKLAGKKILVQELYCIETLARVDVLCLDKTGTITEGNMEISDIIPCENINLNNINNILNNLTFNLQDKNPTFMALRNKFNKKTGEKSDKIMPFSSERKWSGIYFKNKGSYILGAPEFVLKNNNFNNQVQEYLQKGRVLVLGHSENCFNNNNLPENIKILAFILIKDKIRKDAVETLDFFNKQGVKLKIISGDSVLTVKNIAKTVKLENYNKYIDMSKLKTEKEIKEAALNYTVFGRVSPAQKKQIILALKENNHTVAMTGDGVNDVLALKEADCSIAMASGSDAARNVSQLVLLKSDFSAMPKVVEEGRKAINNIQRSSSLFLVKTIYSTLFAIIFLFLNTPYPFKPVQMTLISSLTYGIPSFILALEPNKDLIKGNFFKNIISKALPGAITVTLNISLLNLVSCFLNISRNQISTISVITIGFTGFLLLYKVCSPFNLLRKILFSFNLITFAFAVITPEIKSIFYLVNLNIYSGIILVISLLISYFIHVFTFKISDYINTKKLI